MEPSSTSKWHASTTKSTYSLDSAKLIDILGLFPKSFNGPILASLG